MPVYVDDMRMQADVPNGPRVVSGRWSHLMADTDDELHEFAARLGMCRGWVQYPGTWKSHYDLTDSMRQRALRMGALPIQYLVDGPRLLEARHEGVCFADVLAVEATQAAAEAEAEAAADRLF